MLSGSQNIAKVYDSILEVCVLEIILPKIDHELICSLPELLFVSNKKTVILLVVESITVLARVSISTHIDASQMFGYVDIYDCIASLSGPIDIIL